MTSLFVEAYTVPYFRLLDIKYISPNMPNKTPNNTTDFKIFFFIFIVPVLQNEFIYNHISLTIYQSQKSLCEIYVF